MSHASLALALLTVPILACGSSNEPAPSEPAATSGATNPQAVPPPEPAPPPPEPVPPPEPEPPAKSYAPDPSGAGDPCSEESPCGWDDPCIPTRCVGREHVGSSPACDESAPPPGECMCLSGQCALRPTAPPPDAPPVSCKMSGSCGLDRGAGRCVEGAMLDANRTTRDQGPACHCNFGSAMCEFTWVEPIACETVEQCWVSDSAPYHPIPRPRSLRGRKFRPCQDGEVAPLCTNGHCTVAGYSC